MSQKPNSTVDPKIVVETEHSPDTAVTPLPVMIPVIGDPAIKSRIVSTQSDASGDSTVLSREGIPGMTPLSGVGSSRQPAEVQSPPPPPPEPPGVPPTTPDTPGVPFAPAPPTEPAGPLKPYPSA